MATLYRFIDVIDCRFRWLAAFRHSHHADTDERRLLRHCYATLLPAMPPELRYASAMPPRFAFGHTQFRAAVYCRLRAVRCFRCHYGHADYAADAYAAMPPLTSYALLLLRLIR